VAAGSSKVGQAMIADSTAAMPMALRMGGPGLDVARDHHCEREHEGTWRGLGRLSLSWAGHSGPLAAFRLAGRSSGAALRSRILSQAFVTSFRCRRIGPDYGLILTIRLRSCVSPRQSASGASLPRWSSRLPAEILIFFHNCRIRFIKLIALGWRKASWQLCNIDWETVSESQFMKKIYCVEI
jgi:hypothetical protein